MPGRSEKCYECEGEMVFLSGPGRMVMYRNVECEMPHNVPILTCPTCGSSRVNSQEIALFSDSLEEQRLAKQKPSE